MEANMTETLEAKDNKNNGTETKSALTVKVSDYLLQELRIARRKAEDETRFSAVPTNAELLDEAWIAAKEKTSTRQEGSAGDTPQIKIIRKLLDTPLNRLDPVDVMIRVVIDGYLTTAMMSPEQLQAIADDRRRKG